MKTSRELATGGKILKAYNLIRESLRNNEKLICFYHYWCYFFLVKVTTYLHKKNTHFKIVYIYIYSQDYRNNI